MLKPASAGAGQRKASTIPLSSTAVAGRSLLAGKLPLRCAHPRKNRIGQDEAPSRLASASNSSSSSHLVENVAVAAYGGKLRVTVIAA